MSSLGRLTALVGEWSGVKRLWLTPRFSGQGVRAEPTASVMLAEAPSQTDLFWIDSWHMGDVPWGSYKAPPGLDGEDSVRLTLAVQVDYVRRLA